MNQSQIQGYFINGADTPADVYGHNMSAIYNFTFTSVRSLRVVSTNPVENSTGVSLTSPVIVNFNENITMGSAFNGIYIKNMNTGTMVALSSKVINGSTLTITMNSSRLFSDVYLVVIPVDAVKDSFGDNLTSAYNFTFTSVPLLRVVSSNPLENSTGISLTSPVIIKFNENITADSAFNGIYIKNLSTGAVISVPSKMINGNTLTITFSHSRLYNDVYKVVIPVDAVHDGLGYNLSSEYILTFKTLK